MPNVKNANLLKQTILYYFSNFKINDHDANDQTQLKNNEQICI